MSGDLVTVFSTNKQWEAQLVASLLKDCEIPVHIAGESVGELYGLFNTSLGLIRLQVIPENQQPAEEIINDYTARRDNDDGETDEPDAAE